MEHFNLPVRRFVGPVIAVYLLHWGLWSLVTDLTQIAMSGITQAFNWFADLFGVGRIETAAWSLRWLASEGTSWGLLPIALGLLVAWVVFMRKQQQHSTS